MVHEHDVRIEIDLSESSVGHDRVRSSTLVFLIIPDKVFNGGGDTF
jgi:hypothetical protein